MMFPGFCPLIYNKQFAKDMGTAIRTSDKTYEAQRSLDRATFKGGHNKELNKYINKVQLKC